MKTLHYFVAGLFSLALTGCVSFTPAGPIGDAKQRATITQPYGVKVEDVVISDAAVRDNLRSNLSSQFTQQLSRHIETGEYFEQVISFPATLGEQDVVLKLNFTSLKGKRTPHPAYIPGALITLTMWIWVNGPIYVDKYDLAGELTIESAQGKRLASSRKAIKLDNNTGIWDRDYFNTSLGAEQLDRLVEALLQDSTQQLTQP
jgi:hypothetical protein